VTIGTWDGANIEMAEEVGPGNIFIFGHKAEEIAKLRREGYTPREYLKNDSVLGEVVKLIQEDFFSQSEKGVFKPLCDSLLSHDPFMVFADFGDYLKAHGEVVKSFKDEEAWTKKSIMNTANSGRFSSDRTVSEYADEIWEVGYDRN